MFIRYPVLILLIPYITGILLGPVAIFLWAVKAAVNYKPSNEIDIRLALQGLTPILMAAAGMPNYYETDLFHEKDIPIEIEGTITDGPWLREDFERRYEIELDSSIIVRIKGSFPNSISVGDKVRLKGRRVSWGRKYYLDSRPELIDKAGREEGFLIHWWIYQARKMLWNGLQSTLYRTEASLAGAMLLGLSHKIQPNVKSVFRNTGTSHLLAISGLHIGLIALMIRAVFSNLGIADKNRFVPTIVLLFAFCLISGGRIPVLRAFIVCFFHLYATRINRSIDPFTPLFNACLMLLVLEPSSLFDLSFQLSFAGYSAILFYLRIQNSIIKRLGRLSSPPLKGIFFYFGISFASWIGTLPLILYYFQCINPWTPVINLIVFPLFFAAMCCSMIHLIAVLVHLHHSLITIWPSETSIDLFFSTVKMLEEVWPGAIRTSQLPGLAISLFYGGIIIIFILLSSKKKGR